MNIDKALEYLDKAVVVYENAEDSVRDNWKPAAIGAVGGAILTTVAFTLWVARQC